MTAEATELDAQAWADSLDDVGQAMLAGCMRACIEQGRMAALDEMLDAALSIQRTVEGPERAVAGKLVSAIMRAKRGEDATAPSRIIVA